jgi:hypothetical protein
MVGASTGIGKGWTVYGAEGGKIGEVDEVHPTYLKLRKGLLFKKDVYVPTAAISRLRGDEVHLSAREDDVDALGWDTPPGPAGGGPPRPWVTVERIPHDAQVAPLIERVFSREVWRIPGRAEEVSIEKRPVISGEVAVTRERTTERTRAETSVRKLSVEVEEN